MTVKMSDRIYYTGDMANCSGWGTVSKVYPADRFTPAGAFDLTLDDGRLFRGLYPNAIAPGAGRRFIPKETYDSERAERLLAFARAGNR